MNDQDVRLLEAVRLAHEVCALRAANKAAHDKYEASLGDAVLSAAADQTRDALWIRQPYLLAKVCQLSPATLAALKLITESVRV